MRTLYDGLSFDILREAVATNRSASITAKGVMTAYYPNGKTGNGILNEQTIPTTNLPTLPKIKGGKK